MPKSRTGGIVECHDMFFNVRNTIRVRIIIKTCVFIYFKMTESSSSSTTAAASAPVAREESHIVRFGHVEGEERGGNAKTCPLFKVSMERDDPLFWMRDDTRTQPEILAHLAAENDYCQDQTRHLEAKRADLYREHLSHLKETDSNPAYRVSQRFFYYSRTEEGKSYQIHCRTPIIQDADAAAGSAAAAENQERRFPRDDAIEQVILNENLLAEGRTHCDIHALSVSPDHTMLAYSVDFTGDEIYEIVIIDIATGEALAPHLQIVNKITSGSIVWGGISNSSSGSGTDDDPTFTIYYTTPDEIHRPFRLVEHVFSRSDVAPEEGEEKDIFDADTILFQDNDIKFWMGISKSESDCFLIVETASDETSECHTLDLTDSLASLKLVTRRRPGLRYSVDHYCRRRRRSPADPDDDTTKEEDLFLIVTNLDGCVNNQLMSTLVSQPEERYWTTVVPYNKSRFIESVHPFKNHCVIEGREGGLTSLWKLVVGGVNQNHDGKLQDAHLEKFEFPSDIYTVHSAMNAEFDSNYFRVNYSNPTTPSKCIDIDMRCNVSDTSSGRILIKQQSVLNFDPSLYRCRQMFATAPDQTKIPISLVFRRDIFSEQLPCSCLAQPRPLHLYGYGSYGLCIDPEFDARNIPYLDNGVIFAIAHVRGGGEMGRHWYEEGGKYLTKRNTFSDFIACAEHLIAQGWTVPEKMSCEGRSAGGLLVGNVVNMRPDLFRCAISGVPFVDIMTTMCDPSIPLTSNEWEVWGNPNSPKYFDYMLSYSPIDNVRNQPYPDILVTAGLNDPRVAYWEPAKWVARLRKHNTSTQTHIIAKFDLTSGHFSASDRYRYLREKSYDQAFVLDKLGANLELKFE